MIHLNIINRLKWGDPLRKRKVRSFNIFPIIILMIFIAIIAGVLYFVFEKPSSVTCGIVLERKENLDSVDMKLGYGTETKWIKVSKRLNIPEGIAYNVKIKGIVVRSIEACKVYTGKVYMRSSNSLLLENKTMLLDKSIHYYQVKGAELKACGANSVIIGATNDKFIENNGKIAAILVSPPDVKDIRVGISNSDFSSYEHKDLIMHTMRGFRIQTDTVSSLKLKSEYIEISYVNRQIELRSLTKNGNNLIQDKTIFTTSSRVTIASLNDNPIYIDSLKRLGYSYTPKYYGKLELSLSTYAMHLVNEVDIEAYLRFAILSPILPLGGMEGYKVQAVAARTYVLWTMLSGRFSKYGFHIDDTTNCLAYNSQPSNNFYDQAILETKGEVLAYHNKVIDPKYYSTSCGVGAPYNEIWYANSLPNNANPEPYLSFRNYSSSQIKDLDLSNNFDTANFLKDWTINSYDSNSPYFRWKYTLNIKDLNNIINHKIYELYKANSLNFKKKRFFSYYKNAIIPKDGIGTITDINVNKRGKAGNVLELIINSDTGTYIIDKEYNIKRLIVDNNSPITLLYGNPLMNQSQLPSPYYVIDKEMSNNSIKNITVYGGGLGDGVGMSQYGVIGLIRQNKTYKDILNIFYKNVVFDSYTSVLSKVLD